MLRGAFAGTGAPGQNMAQFYHTKGLTFSARSAKYSAKYKGRFCVRGAYWKRPTELRDKKDVNSTQEHWDYEGGGRFDSLEEAEFHIEPFRACVEYMRAEECDRGGGGGGGGASHKKDYAAAVSRPEFTRSGGRNEELAKAAVEERLKKRSSSSRGGGAEKKKPKLPPGLDASVRARRTRRRSTSTNSSCCVRRRR